MPGYGVSVFPDHLQDGDLLGAIGLPIAAGTGLITMAAAIEFMVIQEALTDFKDELDIF